MKLLALHERLGAVFREDLGGRAVAHYGDPRAGYHAIAEGAGVVDLSHHGFLRLAGGDRLRFLQGMTTANVASRHDGEGAYSILLNDRGRVVADAAVLVTDDAVYLDVEPPARELLPAFFDRFIIMDDVEIADITEERVLLGVYGPNASHCCAAAIEATLEPLPPFSHRLIGSVRVVRRDRWGSQGLELVVPVKEAPTLFERLQGAGALPVGVEATEMFRIEAGIPRAFIDMDDSTIMLEAGLDHHVDREKGCYLGQEVIIRALDRGGIKRRLAGLKLSGLTAPSRGDTVLLEEREIGRVTSATVTPVLDTPVALAILHKSGWDPGTQVTVAGVPATVAALPFEASEAAQP